MKQALSGRNYWNMCNVLKLAAPKKAAEGRTQSKTLVGVRTGVANAGRLGPRGFMD